MFESWFCSEISSKWSELVDQPIWQVSPQLWGYCNKFNTHTLKLQVHVAQSTPIRVSNLKIAIAFTPDLQHLNKRGYSHLTKTFPQSSSHEISWLLPHCSIRGHIWNVGAFQSISKQREEALRVTLSTCPILTVLLNIFSAHSNIPTAHSRDGVGGFPPSLLFSFNHLEIQIKWQSQNRFLFLLFLT